jgi:glycosyltransferase involved in cell wall biosynthesis
MSEIRNQNNDLTDHIKVAQICPRYHPYIGGVETHVKEISERLVSKRLEVEVLTTDPEGTLPESEIINNVLVKRFKSWAPNDSYYFSKQLSKYLKRKDCDYDILHAHSYHAFPALITANNKGKSKLIFTPHYHGEGHTTFRSMLHIPYKYFGKSIFKKSEKIITVSKYERNLIKTGFNVNDEKLVTIPNGINKNEFTDIRPQKKENRIILSVGRLEKYKGMQHLLLLLPEIDNDINLEIIGKGMYKKVLTELITQKNLQDRVTILQDIKRKDLVQKYANADLFALLSLNEAFGICVAEALATFTPCVVANTSGLSEWIDDKNCFGVGVPIDYSELKTVVEYAIKQKVAKVELWDWDDVSEQLIKEYRKIQNEEISNN